MILLQDIKFPLVLDVFDLCTEELQQKLIPARDQFKAWEDAELEKAQKVLLLHTWLELFFWRYS